MTRLSSSLRYELRKSLCDKFGGRCAYCGANVGMQGTVDHYLPEALGGTSEKHNLRWCCNTCNGEKADMHPDEWALRIPVRAAPTTKAHRKAKLLASIAQGTHTSSSQ